VVSSTPRLHFTPGKDLVPIVQEAGWASGQVWTGAENLVPHRDSIPGPSSPRSVAIPTELPGPQDSIKAASKIPVRFASRRQLTTHIRYASDGFCSTAEISQQEFGFDTETVPHLTAEDRDGTESLQLETQEEGRDYG
jgi:hypothetical protein